MLLFLLLPLAHGLRFHPYFTPGMVLQRDAANIIWGYDALGEVRASLSCSGEKGGTENQKTIGSATISAAGLWQVELPARPAGLVCSFKASTDTEELVLEDLLIGDIWLCSGQSNMEFSVAEAFGDDGSVGGLIPGAASTHTRHSRRAWTSSTRRGALDAGDGLRRGVQEQRLPPAEQHLRLLRPPLRPLRGGQSPSPARPGAPF